MSLLTTLRTIVGNLRYLARSDLSDKLTDPITTKDISDFASLAVRPGAQSSQHAAFDINEYSKAFKGPTYIAAGAIARKVAMQEAHVFLRRNSKSGIILEPAPIDHPLAILFDEVNSRDVQYDLWFQTMSWLLVAGNAMWLMVRNGLRRPSEIWPVPPAWCKPIPSAEDWIAEWEVNGLYSGGGVHIPAIRSSKDDGTRNAMIHIKMPHTDWAGAGRFYGRPPLYAAAEMADNAQAMVERQWRQFKNFVPPGLVFTDPKRLPDSEFDDKYGQILALWRKMEMHGAPMLLHDGMTVDNLNPTPREMDYQASMELAMDFILGVYGVPKAVVGLVQDVNRANMLASMESFCQNTVNPLLRMLEQRLTQDIGMEYQTPVIVKFSPCTVEDADQMRRNIETAMKGGAVTPNEVREHMLGFGPFKTGGESPIVPPQQVEATWGNKRKSIASVNDYIGAWSKQHDQLSDSFAKTMERELRKQEQIVLENIGEFDKAPTRLTPDMDLLPKGAIDEQFQIAATGQMDKAAIEGMELEFLRMGIDVPQDVMDAVIRSMHAHFNAEYWLRFTDGTRKRISGLIIEAIAEGRPTEWVVQELGKEFGKVRATRIARTETTAGLNGGHYHTRNELMKEGVVIGSVWEATLDQATRMFHMVADGQRRRVGELFMIGGQEARYPGDPLLRPDNRINCRCFTVPILPGERV